MVLFYKFLFDFSPKFDVKGDAWGEKKIYTLIVLTVTIVTQNIYVFLYFKKMIMQLSCHPRLRCSEVRKLQPAGLNPPNCLVIVLHLLVPAAPQMLKQTNLSEITNTSTT